ncbi:MAG: hypothetical protein NC332_02690, partial [Firmicutes bacterium]|nr:hypothetical protein [Bacillota bacterium]
YGFIIKNNLFAYNGIYNVNIPPQAKSVAITKQGGAYFSDEFVKVDDFLFDQQGYSVYNIGNNLELDTDATMNGYVSITPLSAKRDNIDAYRQIKKVIK